VVAATAWAMTMTITLADLDARSVDRLTIACDRCSRRGVYTVARLIEQHGRDHDLVSLRLRLAADCPAYHTGRGTPLCGARYLMLPRLFLA
jgi:hypothetical protein